MLESHHHLRERYRLLLGGASLALDPVGDDISLFGDDDSLTDGDVYPPVDESLGASTATRHTSTSKVKQDTSLPTQEFNATLSKEKEANVAALSYLVTLKV